MTQVENFFVGVEYVVELEDVQNPIIALCAITTILFRISFHSDTEKVS